jgi:hypothetical protein
MNNPQATLRMVALAVHGLAVVAVVLLFLKTSGMTVFCVVPGALIGCACVAAQPGRQITVYAAFGFLMGFVFWDCASIVNQKAFLVLIVVALIAAGAVWFLRSPTWPAVLFTAIAVLLRLAIAASTYRHRFDTEYDPNYILRSVLTVAVVLSLGLVYLGLGFAETVVQKSSKRKGRRVRPRDDDE